MEGRSMVKTRSWADKLKDWRKKHEEAYAKAVLSPPPKTTIYRTIPFPGVVLIMGHRRWGKSGLAHEIANQFHNKRHVKGVLHLPDVPDPVRRKVQKLLPKWFTVVTSRADWPKNAIVLYDEASQSAHARRSQSSAAVDLDNLIGICGQRNQLILFVCHHSRKLDINVVRGVDLIMWKRPTQAHAVFERDELSDFAFKALEFFSEIKGDVAKKKATLVMDFQNLKFSQFNNSLPPWWTDELSRIFQDIKDMTGSQRSKGDTGKGVDRHRAICKGVDRI